MIKEIQDKVFLDWFCLEVINDNGVVSGQLRCVNRELNTYIRKIHNTYRFKIGLNDFLEEAAYNTYLSLGKFEVREGRLEDWPNQRKLMAYVKETLAHQSIRFSNPETLFTTSHKAHIKIVMPVSSLDIVLMGFDGQSNPMMETVPSEANLLELKDGYKATHFMTWFRAQKANFLTEKELLLLEKLPQYINNNGQYSMAQHEATGVQNKHLKRYLDRIKEKTLAAYQADQKGAVIVSNLALLERSYKNLMAQEETEDGHIKLFIKEAMENEEFTELISEGLSLAQQKELNRFYQGKGDISNKILYLVNEAIMKAQEPQYKEVEINNGWELPKEERMAPGGIYEVNTYGVMNSLGQ